MQKLSHFVADFLFKQGISHVFGVTGGAVAHLFDSISQHGNMQAIFHHHEQAAAFAAQAYARINNRLGCAFVTTGPGGTNAITGVSAAWLDSVPCIYISGQTRLQHTSQGKGLRQFGTQELDIVSLVTPITKKAVMVRDPQTIQSILEEAVFIATHGRPGPVWIDIPLDMQWAMIEPDQLAHFIPLKQEKEPHLYDQEIYFRLSQSKRPLVLLGYGVKLAKAENTALQWLNKMEIPFVTTWNATDVASSYDVLNIGRPGIFGQRGANLAVQNCDLLIVLGSHLCSSITGTLFKAFAREAKIIMVNIDEKELAHRTIPVDLPIRADVLDVLKNLNEKAPDRPYPHHKNFKEKCAFLKMKFNGLTSDFSYYGCSSNEVRVNPYVFLDALSQVTKSQDIIVVDGGGTIVQIAFQSLKIKKGQRLIIDAGLCAMGSGLPQSIGAYFAHRNSVICLCGDGSLQFNVHELQTIAHHKIPIKLFVFNNEGYLSIRHTQKSFLNSNYTGSSEEGGVSLPNIHQLAAAYRIHSTCISTQDKATQEMIRSVLDYPGPILCEVLVPKEFSVAPKQGFRVKDNGTFSPAPLEEMLPSLSEEEFTEAMLVSSWQDK